MKKKLIVNLLRLLVIAYGVISMVACDMSGGESGQKGQEEKPIFEMISGLFENAGTDVEGKQVTRMHTNDVRYWSQRGYTVWTAWGADNLAPFIERTVEVSKTKGYIGAGYGLVICQGTRVVEGKEIQTMLTVIINNNGQYAVGKVIGGIYEDIVSWKHSPSINNIGAGAPTTIQVIGKGAGVFSLFFNGNYIQDFSDTKEPVHSGGRNGYIVVIAPADRFAQEEVDVHFTELR